MNHGIAVFPLECTTALPYMSLVQTVVETPEYLAAAKRAGMPDAERESAVNFIAANPDAGEIVPGTGGCRKVRVAKESSAEHTSELQSLMPISYAFFCLHTQNA